MAEPEREVKRIVLGAVDECAVCGHEYDDDSVAVIGQQGDLWVMLLRCDQCQRQGIIAALINAGADEASIIPFDPAAPDQWAALEPIGAHDVQSIRTFLATFDGNFARYLAEAGE